jgi:hypothetical protein
MTEQQDRDASKAEFQDLHLTTQTSDHQMRNCLAYLGKATQKTCVFPTPVLSFRLTCLSTDMKNSSVQREATQQALCHLHEIVALATALTELLKTEQEQHHSFIYIGSFLEKSLLGVQNDLTDLERERTRFASRLRSIEMEQGNIDRDQRLLNKKMERIMMKKVLNGLELSAEPVESPRRSKSSRDTSPEKSPSRKLTMRRGEDRVRKSRSNERDMRSKEKQSPEDGKSTRSLNDSLPRNAKLLARSSKSRDKRDDMHSRGRSSTVNLEGTQQPVDLVLVRTKTVDTSKALSILLKEELINEPAPKEEMDKEEEEIKQNLQQTDEKMSELAKQLADVRAQSLELEKRILHIQEVYKYLTQQTESISRTLIDSSKDTEGVAKLLDRVRAQMSALANFDTTHVLDIAGSVSKERIEGEDPASESRREEDQRESSNPFAKQTTASLSAYLRNSYPTLMKTSESSSTTTTSESFDDPFLHYAVQTPQ